MGQGITFIGEKPAPNNHAGNKARVDADAILREKYGKPYENLEEIVFTGLAQKVRYLLNLSNMKQICRIRQMRSQKVIMQYPFYFNPVLKKALRDTLGKNEVIFLVHDVNALRSFLDADIKNEISELNLAKAVIVHNDSMGTALQKLGLTVPWISLELFDYLLPDIPQRSFSKGTTVVFAGNLGKSKFLRNGDMETLGLHFNLYGPGFNEEVIKWKNLSYKGSFPPDEIPFQIEGNFGLLWDGSAVKTCDGPTGAYMKYNNPHKLSLYIAAGLPVIVWKQAAVAAFVTAYKIGIAVESLTDVPEKIQALSDEEYHAMVMAVKTLQNQVVHGRFTQRCLERAERQVFS
ncbi:MAG: hypothetical protein IJQ30_00080 [Acidaminococcaceae bacterium]|nr:hypothetical protein [Acidaminococcaceae bacterium]MBQ6912637.1 hypothetical protein [Acidaminococcaceae bacterium]